MRERHLEGDELVRPNEILYNACIDVWAKSGAQFAGRRAEQILIGMEEGGGMETNGVRLNTMVSLIIS